MSDPLGLKAEIAKRSMRFCNFVFLLITRILLKDPRILLKFAEGLGRLHVFVATPPSIKILIIGRGECHGDLF